jgi:hypothetical protein
MSKEKGTPAQKGTGAKLLAIQKLHRTGEGNVKFKLNRFAAKRLFRGKSDVLKAIQKRMVAKGIF